MLADARKEGLNVDGVVADIIEFNPDGEYDVIMLDRVLHMLKDDNERLAVLEKVSHHTKRGGFVLIADMPSNIRVFVKFFTEKHGVWEKRKADRGFLYFQKKLVPESEWRISAVAACAGRVDKPTYSSGIELHRCNLRYRDMPLTSFWLSARNVTA